ncbi:MAG: pyruvate dehydrogenase E2 component (dihydrolipoamide acetyltransferase) [Parcubacteria group bacterium Gr01-1014_30]|nr:MAG: pyruvate dehydrogenase E2 component (dihydrolipoamide acetyltransferase) [Parcubacteria group bacterium Gr01-1014_30]
MKEFKFPDIGEGIEEGKIVKWLVKEGDFIKEHQAVGEVETDKAVAEIPSPFEGAILKINFKEGETVKVGEVLFVVGEKGEKTVSAAKTNSKTAEDRPPRAQKLKAAGAVGYLEEAAEGETLATPSVRKLAKELGVNLAKIKGTGPGGRITEKDLPVVKKPEIKKKRKYDLWGYVDYVPLNNIRRVTARHMTEAWLKAPQVTIMSEPEVKKLVKFREKEGAKAEKKGIKLTFLPFIMKACWQGMKEFPLLNSSFDDGAQEVIVKKYYNFGVAVDVDGEGLVVPVVKGVDMKNCLDIAKEIVELANKARKKKLDIQEMRGGTFTITNYGSLGGVFATPIINYPEAAILGLGRIRDEKFPLSLTFDHRILDGAYAVRFLNSLGSHLQSPEKLFILT